MKTKSLFVLIILILTGCDSLYFTLEGSGIITQEARTLPEFTEVELTGVADVEILPGSSPLVVIETDQNLLDYVVTRVSGNRLEITQTANHTLSPTRGIKVTVFVSTLTAVTLTGTGNMAVQNRIAGTLDVNLTGTGNMTLSGTTACLNLRLVGTGDIRALGMSGSSVKVNLEGLGDVYTTCTGVLDARLSGVGSIRYAGNPDAVLHQITGVGSIGPY